MDFWSDIFSFSMKVYGAMREAVYEGKLRGSSAGWWGFLSLLCVCGGSGVECSRPGCGAGSVPT